MAALQLETRIVEWLRERVREAGAQGVAVGLSGGIDSAVVAALARRALGDAVLGALLPCHSLPQDEEHARLVAERFGIATQRVDLGAVYDALLAALPPARRPLAVANLKPRLRMATLYYLATERGYLVAGTGNKSELLAGYFTKHGDGGVDLLPIGGLYKTQVRTLARGLGVPAAIVDKPPSAGLWEGQTDEEELGISYAELDRTLAALAAGEREDLDPAAVARVERLQRNSAHKRAMPPVFTPIEV